MIAILLALIWSAAVVWRIYRLARFFQIEEYNSPRFLRWIIGKRTRYAPNRFLLGLAAGLGIVGIALAVGIDAPAFHWVWWTAVAVFVAYPEPVKEIKKRFVRTQRATRLLATAFIVAVGGVIGISMLLANALRGEQSQSLFGVAGVGLTAYFLAPLALPAANQLMYPVEATLRRGFREKARRRLAQAKPIVIGITGSYGKTSTKEYIAHILSGKYKVLATPKSYNTLMGVCITINNELDPTAGYEYFVVEMGAYIKGEIKRICQLARPHISVVSAIGPQHLERFGSLENTVTAKYEIIAALPPEGVGVFNGDDHRVREMARRGHPQTRWLISYTEPPAEDCRLVAKNVRHTREGLVFEVEDRTSGSVQIFNTRLIGLHNVTNVLLASAVALQTGMTLPEIALRVTTLAAPDHRLRRTVTPAGITVIDDAYNTNPVGAANALQVLGLYQEGKRILITPGMVEMGSLQESENEKLGALAVQYCTHIALVGAEQTRPIQNGVKKVDGAFANLFVFETLQEAIVWYQGLVQAGDAVLFLNDLPDIYFN